MKVTAMEFKPGNLYKVKHDVMACLTERSNGTDLVTLRKNDLIMFVRFGPIRRVGPYFQKETSGIFLPNDNQLIPCFQMIRFPESIIKEVKI